LRICQDAARPNPDVQHAHVLLEAGREHAAEVLASLPQAWQAPPGGAGIDCIVIDLRGIKAAAPDDLQTSGCLAGNGDSASADAPQLLEPVERVGYSAGPEHLLHGQPQAVPDAATDVIVQLKERDRVRSQTSEALHEALFDGARDVIG